MRRIRDIFNQGALQVTILRKVSRCLAFSRKWVGNHFYMAKWTLILEGKSEPWILRMTLGKVRSSLGIFLWQVLTCILFGCWTIKPDKEWKRIRFFWKTFPTGGPSGYQTSLGGKNQDNPAAFPLYVSKLEFPYSNRLVRGALNIFWRVRDLLINLIAMLFVKQSQLCRVC